MSDLLINLSQASLWGIIGIGFSAGLAGSLHCVGMCGAFATSCGQTQKGLISYHLGKLTSYGLLGLIAGIFGASFSLISDNPYLKIIPSVLMGIVFIYLGVKSLGSSHLSLSLPKAFEKVSKKWLIYSFNLKEGTRRSFLTGFLSALLPCGLLYGVLLSFAILQNPYYGALGMMAFGLGTIPALTIAPSILSKLIKPIREAWPKMASLSLITLGLITISYRMVVAYEQASCH